MRWKRCSYEGSSPPAVSEGPGCGALWRSGNRTVAEYVYEGMAKSVKPFQCFVKTRGLEGIDLVGGGGERHSSMQKFQSWDLRGGF